MSIDGTYDPSAPEGQAPRSSVYVSKKDIRVVGVALVVLSLMMYPVFKILVRRSEKARCINNMKGIMDSINQYAIQNEDKFPPLFDTGAVDEPVLQASGAPFTWASDLQEYMNPRNTFRCPSAAPAEVSRSQDVRTETGSFPLSYGMFAPMSSFNRSLVEDPDDAALIAETSNLGAENTYDPLPFVDPSGKKLPYDSMAIGWDNDNFDGNDKSHFVTRLAFPNTADALFPKDGYGRHDEGTFVLSVSGHLRTLKPNIARVNRRYGKLYGMWPMPLTAARHH
jgi:hypothetical protein